jgi:hypothetical protein
MPPVSLPACEEALKLLDACQHTWLTWRRSVSRRRFGAPTVFALQKLGGWESPEMVRRYAHRSLIT